MAPCRWAAMLLAAMAISAASCSSSGNPSGGGLEARADLEALLEQCAEIERPGGAPCLSIGPDDADVLDGPGADVQTITDDAQTICEDIAGTDPDRIGELEVASLQSATFDPSEPGIACVGDGVVVSIVLASADADEQAGPCEPDDPDQRCEERADGSRESDLAAGQQAITSRSWPNGDGLFVAITRYGDREGPVDPDNDDLRVALVDTLARAFDLGQ